MTTDVEATQTGASQIDGSDSIANDFLNRITRDSDTTSQSEEENLETSSVEDDENTSEDAPEPSDDDSDADTEQTDGDEVEPVAEKPAKRPISDDDVLTHTVDGVEMTFTAEQIKRDLGRGAVLQRKETEAANKTRLAEDALSVSEALYTDLFAKARAAYAPYEGINLNVVAMREGWDADTLEAVTEQEQKAYANLQYLKDGVTEVQSKLKATTAARVDREVREAIAEIEHPETGIKDFKTVYPVMMNYAHNELGIDQATLADIRNPKLIKALHKLYTLDRGAKVGAEALANKTTKSAKAPTKVLKGSADTRSTGGGDARKVTMDKLSKESSSENIQAAFLARLMNR